MNEQLVKRYNSLLHAMKAGVAMEMQLPGRTPATQPKHLRVGINSALIGQAALAGLLIKKGIISEGEYIEALISEAEAEVKRYETHLSEEMGTPIKLGSLE